MLDGCVSRWLARQPSIVRRESERGEEGSHASTALMVTISGGHSRGGYSGRRRQTPPWRPRGAGFWGRHESNRRAMCPLPGGLSRRDARIMSPKRLIHTPPKSNYRQVWARHHPDICRYPARECLPGGSAVRLTGCTPVSRFGRTRDELSPSFANP